MPAGNAAHALYDFLVLVQSILDARHERLGKEEADSSKQGHQKVATSLEFITNSWIQIILEIKTILDPHFKADN